MRITKIGFILLLSMISLSVFAQNEPVKKQVDVGILYPGLSAEFPLSNKFTLYGRAGLGAGGVGGVAYGGQGVGFIYNVAPMYNLQGRYYYKGVKSETKSGNPLVGNSGMYCFLTAQGHLKPLISSYDVKDNGIFIVGAGWGIQRAYTNRFVWSFGLGYGYSTDGFAGVGELKLGVNLFAK